MTQDNILDEILLKLVNGAQYEYKPSTRQRRRTEAKKALQSLLKQDELRGRIDEIERFSRFGESIEDGTDIVGILAAEHVYAVNRIRELTELKAEMENLS